MNAFHSTYRVVYSALPADVEILDLDLVGNSKLKGGLNLLIAFLNYIYISLRILTSRNRRFFLREFNNYALDFLLLLARTSKKNIFFNLNHNSKSISDFLKLKEKIENSSCHVVMFEHRDPLQSPPIWFFPVDTTRLIKNTLDKSKKITVGIVGSYRKEKKIEDILAIIKHNESSLKGKFNFILGSDFDCRSGDMHDYISYVDTSNHFAYTNLLKNLDTALINYGPEYTFRTSGVINDLLQNSVIPIVPDMEIIRNQVHWPTQVGYVYRDLPGLIEFFERITHEALSNILQDNLPRYQDIRTFKNLHISLTDYFNSTQIDKKYHCSHTDPQ